MSNEIYNINIEKHAVLIYNKNEQIWEDKTSEVLCYRNIYDNHRSYYEITYNSRKSYKYSEQNVQIFCEIKKVNIKNNIPYINGEEWFNLEAFRFGKWVRFIFKDGKSKTYLDKEIKWFQIANNEEKVKDYISYLQEVAQYLEGDNKNILQEQLKNLKVPKESVLYSIIYNKTNKLDNKINSILLPFNFNKSQRDAVFEALTNQISIIAGPPGTGKTQTILNIIANLVYNDKTVAVAAGNNEATRNVLEKLEKENLDFLVASLGKGKNVDAFFEKDNTIPQICHEWHNLKLDVNSATEKLNSLSTNLSELDLRIEVTKLKQNIEDLEREKTVFDTETILSKNISEKLINKIKHYTFKKLLNLKAELDVLSSQKLNSFGNKLHFFRQYGIFKVQKHFAKKDEVIKFLNSMYYNLKLKIKKEELAKKITQLSDLVANKTQQQIIDLSMKLLQKKVMSSVTIADIFNKKNYQYKFKEFQKRFPIVLSTTHSLAKTSGRNYLYDYVIIDESSQVCLASSAIALSCAKNVVLVGDLMQLPHVVESKNKKVLKDIFNKYNLRPYLDYLTNSILKSVETQFKNRIQYTLLNEHYRCDREIIGFCNKRFYDDKLVIQTDHKTGDGVKVIYTESHHARRHPAGGQFNERQVDITEQEILPLVGNEEIGVVTPFKMQVAMFESRFGERFLIDTIHKFRGKEKTNIVLSTVVNKVKMENIEEPDFLNNSNLLNVAISRAQNKLFLIVSEELMNQDGAILSDFARYIKYYTQDGKIEKTNVYSVMDLMYNDYLPILEAFKKKIRKNSVFDSENIVAAVIREICDEKKFGMLDFYHNYPLRDVVKVNSILDDEDKIFAKNLNTHCDFLLFNTLDKTVRLVVEVDGVQHLQSIQSKRDERKDRILKNAKIPIVRIKTTSINVKERIEAALNLK